MKILAVDYGDARTGLAMCDRTEFLASPIGIIEEKSMPKVAEKIVYAAREYEAQMIVIGLPLNMDGTEGERARGEKPQAGEHSAHHPAAAHRAVGRAQQHGERGKHPVRQRHLWQKAQGGAGRGGRHGDPGELYGVPGQPEKTAKLSVHRARWGRCGCKAAGMGPGRPAPGGFLYCGRRGLRPLTDFVGGTPGAQAHCRGLR